MSTSSIKLIDPKLPVNITTIDCVENVGPQLHLIGQGNSSNRESLLMTAVDEKEDIWEVETLLAKWGRGQRV